MFDDPERLPKSAYVITAFVFLVVAVGFVVAGLDTAFTYDSGGLVEDPDGPLGYRSTTGDRIVGGDAYNYIIRAGRGATLVGCGIVSSLFAVVFSLLAVRAQLMSAPPPAPQGRNPAA